MIRRLLALCVLVSAPVWAADDGLVPVPALTAHVTDQTQTLTAPQREALEQKLAAFEQHKGSQIAVLIVPTTQPEEIEQYSIRVVEAWKLGRAKVDDGALLIVAKNDRRLRIEVGRGLEGAVPDAIAKRIIEETITPHFRQNDFYGGVDAGVTQLMAVVQGEALPPPASRRSGDERLANLFGPFFIFWVIGNLLRRLVGTFPASALVGVGTAFAASFLVGSLVLAGGIGVIATIVALVFYSGGAGGGGYYGGGGGFSSGGFGGGGFSGGGGGFSGGGASGRW